MDTLLFLGALLLVWCLGYCGGLFIVTLRKFFDQV